MIRKRLFHILFLAVLFSLFSTVVGCRQTASSPPTLFLNIDQLINKNVALEGPIPNSIFMPGNSAVAAQHEFSGGLKLSPVNMEAKPDFKYRDVIGKDPKVFPGVTIHFFSYQGDLVPIERDIITPKMDDASKSFWEIIVQPGKVWSEPDDVDWSRASFPFVLMNSLEGESHNGIATFAYNQNEVTDLRFQIVNQTAPWYIKDHFIAWGIIPVELISSPVKNINELKENYILEKSNYLTIKPWSALEDTFGNFKLRNFEPSESKRYVVLTALVYDKIIYLKPCKTKMGNYPYAENMRVGVWSVTKSILPSIGMLRLAQKYGPQVFDLKIKDYVKITASHNGWDDVTFADALNMATGIGEGTNSADESMYVDYIETEKSMKFYGAASMQEKLNIAFRYNSYPWGPGKVARYRDHDHFILSVAMNNFLKIKEGATADIWELIKKEVFLPIHIYHAPTTRTIEPNGKKGVPIGCWGFFPTFDDLAKISDLIHNRGKHNGQQILYFDKTNELFSDEGTFEQNTHYENHRRKYKMGFHQIPFYGANNKKLYLPYMSGMAGNCVLLMPGGMTGLRASKAWPASNHVYYISHNPLPMARVGNRIRPFNTWEQ